MINVLEHGVTHDFVDQSDKINKLLEKGECLHFPYGFYRIDKPINLKSGSSLLGDNATFVVLGDTAIEGYEVSDIHIKGFRFNIDGLKTAIRLHSAFDVFISDIVSSGGGVWINQKNNNNIHISNVKAVNSKWIENPTHPDLPYARGVFVEYCENVYIKDCYIEGQSQGIEIWGGNAATDKLREAKNVFVENCVVKNCSGGGIWGANVEKYIISSCTVEHTLDVGIDFEGCIDSIARGNVVSNCRCGNFSIFFICPNITFANNISKQDSKDYINQDSGRPYSTHFALYNGANVPYENTIVFDDCQFISTNGEIGEVTFGACRHRIVRNCYFLNTVLHYNNGTTGHTNSETTSNKFYFNIDVNNLSVILSESHNSMGYHMISGNTIQIGDGERGIAKAINVVGIECYEYNAEGRHFVTNNFVYGCSVGIQGKAEGNKTLYIVANDNVMNNGIRTFGRVNLVKNNNLSISGVARW